MILKQVIWRKLDEALHSFEEIKKPLDNNIILESIREESEAPKKLSFLITRFINLQKNQRLSLSEVESLCNDPKKENKLKQLLRFSFYQDEGFLSCI